MVMNYTKISLTNQSQANEEKVACIGYFDGLHLGHQGLVKKTIELARKYGVKSALITFSPDPWIVIKKMEMEEHLTPLNKRIECAKKLGIDEVIVIDFTEEVSKLPPLEFIQQLLMPLKLKELVCGFDFHYGFKGEGSIETLKKDCEGLFKLSIIDSINDHDEKISTTRIIECLKNGEVKEATTLLGRYYCIEGKVIKGNQKGREIGFPTANIEVTESFVIPKTGVYFGKIRVVDEDYLAMVNIGYNPTFNQVEHPSIEVHILDFEQEIYGKEISLSFIDYLRPEKKFNSVQDLILQLEQDRSQLIEREKRNETETV